MTLLGRGLFDGGLIKLFDVCCIQSSLSKHLFSKILKEQSKCVWDEQILPSGSTTVPALVIDGSSCTHKINRIGSKADPCGNSTVNKLSVAGV